MKRRSTTQQARILLIVGGGIAAYKSLELTRRLSEHGAAVRVILTEAARRFATPLSFAALGGTPAPADWFDAEAAEGSGMGHIDLARFADLIIVAPATADLMARMAAGMADDLATATLLARDAPVLLAPAMNPSMWNHPATRRNVARLRADGALLVGPNEGDTACGETGAGRMAEAEEILHAAQEALHAQKDALTPAPPKAALAGRRALVTSGPTLEAIDSLRFISNRSSGRQGHAIAAALARAGAEVLLVHGPCEIAPPAGVRGVAVESARDMLAACEAALPVDVAVMAAAVGDWHTQAVNGGKLRKDGSGKAIVLELAENPDILKTLSRRRRHRPSLVVGFAAEEGTPQQMRARARAKRKHKGCDWIAVNAIEVMGREESRVHLITSESGGGARLEGAKSAIAEQLAQRIAAALNSKGKVHA